MIQDVVSLTQASKSVKRNFNIEPNKSTIMRWMRLEANRPVKSQDNPSSIISIDEVYPGSMVVIMASDPVEKKPRAAIIAKLKRGQSCKNIHVKRLLNLLKELGIDPKVTVTDEARIYSEEVQRCFPNTLHQLCNFHVLHDIGKHVGQELKRIKTEIRALIPKRGAGRPKGESIPDYYEKEIREHLKHLSKGKYLFTTKSCNLSQEQENVKAVLMDRYPVLKKIGDFMGSVYTLFESRTYLEALKQRKTILTRSEFTNSNNLDKALEQIRNDKTFEKVFCHLKNGHKVRTTGYSEAVNRIIRMIDKRSYSFRAELSLKSRIALQFPGIRPEIMTMSDRIGDDAAEKAIEQVA